MPGTQSGTMFVLSRPKISQVHCLPFGEILETTTHFEQPTRKTVAAQRRRGLALVERHHRVCKTLIKPHITVLRTLFYSAMPSVDDGGIRWINCILKQDGLVTHTVCQAKQVGMLPKKYFN